MFLSMPVIQTVYESSSHFRPVVSDYYNNHYCGACLEKGAQPTVIGLKQVIAYCCFSNTKLKTTNSNNTYRFGNDYQQSVGSLNMCISLSENTFITEKSGCRQCKHSISDRTIYSRQKCNDCGQCTKHALL